MKQRVYLLYGKNELGCISAYGSRKKAIEGAKAYALAWQEVHEYQFEQIIENKEYWYEITINNYSICRVESVWLQG